MMSISTSWPGHDKVEYVLDKPIGVIPNKESPEFATFDVEAHQKYVDNASDAQCVMPSSMSLELQRQHEHMFPYEMLKHLESLYASQAQTMEYEILLSITFKNFIVNFNMNNMKVGLPELHNMLKTYESSTAKVKYVLMVSSSAKSSKWKNKQQQKKKASKDVVLKSKSGA
ncbi:hypothetical protein SASPL_145236 [Salvia splendens]|uniref:Uncharacterized protein n=1 Tax=Salvia splendens TaxID=180675 RepID=A0A8X8Z773_SALSN|nr:hypothetical protein SASPL_145236 [Salvia splendens]